jgi:hypothetical protein
MAEDAAKRDFKTLIDAQELLDQELSRRLNIDSLAVPACSLCLAYQDQEPHLLNEAGNGLGNWGPQTRLRKWGSTVGKGAPIRRRRGMLCIRNVLKSSRIGRGNTANRRRQPLSL